MSRLRARLPAESDQTETGARGQIEKQLKGERERLEMLIETMYTGRLDIQQWRTRTL